MAELRNIKAFRRLRSGSQNHEQISERLRQAGLRRGDGRDDISASGDASSAHFVFHSGLSRVELGQDTGRCRAIWLRSH